MTYDADIVLEIDDWNAANGDARAAYDEDQLVAERRCTTCGNPHGENSYRRQCARCRTQPALAAHKPQEATTMTTTDIEPRAACAGQSRLFESTEHADHRRARNICENVCTVRAACEAKLRDELQRGGPGDPGGAPIGTWAGQLFTHSSGGGKTHAREVAA